MHPFLSTILHICKQTPNILQRRLGGNQYLINWFLLLQLFGFFYPGGKIFFYVLIQHPYLFSIFAKLNRRTRLFNQKTRLIKQESVIHLYNLPIFSWDTIYSMRKKFTKLREILHINVTQRNIL